MERGIGDVLLAWENEAYLAIAEARTKSRSSCRRSAFSRSRRLPSWTRWSTGMAHERSRVHISSSCIRRRARRSRHEITTVRATEGRGEIRRHVRQGEAVHHRRGVWGMGQRAEGALRRRRNVRSDLPTRRPVNRRSCQNIGAYVTTTDTLGRLCWFSPSLPRRREPNGTAAAPEAGCPACAMVGFQNATLNLRYRFIDTSAGSIATNQLQHRESLRARLKFDAPGRYAMNFGAFHGVPVHQRVEQYGHRTG